MRILFQSRIIKNNEVLFFPLVIDEKYLKRSFFQNMYFSYLKEINQFLVNLVKQKKQSKLFLFIVNIIFYTKGLFS